MAWNGFSAPISLTPITTAWAITNIGDNLVDHEARITDLEVVAFPSGVGGWVRQASEIPSGFARESNLDGRIPVGAGTSFSVTYVEATNYGSAWAHQHQMGNHVHNDGHAHTNASQTGVAQNGTAYDEDETGGGHNTQDDQHHHSLSDTGGRAGGSVLTGDMQLPGINVGLTSWVIPSRAVVWVRKT